MLGVKNEGAGDLAALFSVQRGEVVSDPLPDRLDGMRIALTKERSRMYSISVTGSPSQGMLRPSSMPETTEPGMASGAKLGSGSEAAAGYDADLLVAALEDIELRRAAIEWLLEADLLCVCLV